MRFKFYRISDLYRGVKDPEQDIEINTLEELEELDKNSRLEVEHHNLKVDLQIINENYRYYDGLIVNFKNKTIASFDDIN